MKRIYRLMILVSMMLGWVWSVVRAEVVVPEKWLCQWCEFEQGFYGDIDLGLGHISTDAAKFGEYTGQDKAGPYIIGQANVHYRDEQAYYFDADVMNLGLDSRSISLSGGEQGHYDIDVAYSRLPQLTTDSAQSPFLGIGSNELSLSPQWVRAGSADEMTSLASDLKQINIEQTRDKYDLEIRFRPAPKRELYHIKYTRERKQGTHAIGAAFGVDDAFASTVTLLPKPIDYTTDLLEFGVSYMGRRWQAGFGYEGSFFRNRYEALTWKNPFTNESLANEQGGQELGQYALAPDNAFHQLSLSWAYKMTSMMRLVAHVTAGKMTQNETFLPYTSQAELATSELPRSSLSGEVSTWSALVEAHARPFEKLRLHSKFQQQEQDNKTPSSVYDYVITDTAISTIGRMNKPFGCRSRKLQLDGSYQLTPHMRLAAGGAYQTFGRNYQAVSTHREKQRWGEFLVRANGLFTMKLKYHHNRRNGEAYVSPDDLVLPENPLLRKFNMASRDHRRVATHLSLALHETVNLDIQLSRAENDYSQSTLGLTASEDTMYSLDLTVMPHPDMVVNGFYTQERYQFEQSGSQTYANPDWFNVSTDKVHTLGFGIKYMILEDTLDVGMDMAQSRSREDHQLDSDSLDLSLLSLPDASSRFRHINFYTNYQVNENFSIKLNYLYERYTEDDFAMDNISVDSVANTLTLGEQENDYDVHLVATTVRYRF